MGLWREEAVLTPPLPQIKQNQKTRRLVTNHKVRRTSGKGPAHGSTPITFRVFTQIRVRQVFSHMGWLITACFCFSCLLVALLDLLPPRPPLSPTREGRRGVRQGRAASELVRYLSEKTSPLAFVIKLFFALSRTSLLARAVCESDSS